jgi:hypothetical protein
MAKASVKVTNGRRRHENRECANVAALRAVTSGSASTGLIS